MKTFERISNLVLSYNPLDVGYLKELESFGRITCFGYYEDVEEWQAVVQKGGPFAEVIAVIPPRYNKNLKEVLAELGVKVSIIAIDFRDGIAFDDMATIYNGWDNYFARNFFS